MPDKVDYSKLTLVRLSDEQGLAAIEDVIPHWLAGRGYKTAEEVLEFLRLANAPTPDHPWALDDNIVSWGLVPRDNTSTTDLLSHCDTYRRKGVITRPDGTQTEVTSYVMSAVFTPDQHRGKGYATHMMRLMHYALAPKDKLPPFPSAWGAPPTNILGDAAFSVLYSDVGPRFYAKCTKGADQPGWVAIKDPPPHRKWHVEATEDDRSPPSDWEWLDYDNIIPLEDKTAAWMKLEAKRRGDKSCTRIYNSPDNGWFRACPLRERAFKQAVGRPVGDAILGLRLGRDSDAPFFTFSVSDEPPQPPRLIVDFLYRPEHIPFSAVRAAAAQEGVSHIELWGRYEGWDVAAEGGQPKLSSVDDLVPSVAQYGLVEKDEDLEWLWCEHYLFC